MKLRSYHRKNEKAQDGCQDTPDPWPKAAAWNCHVLAGVYSTPSSLVIQQRDDLIKAPNVIACKPLAVR
jgi:hypothetical protein